MTTSPTELQLLQFTHRQVSLAFWCCLSLFSSNVRSVSPLTDAVQMRACKVFIGEFANRTLLF